jgi:hypothetical protein
VQLHDRVWFDTQITFLLTRPWSKRPTWRADYRVSHNAMQKAWWLGGPLRRKMPVSLALHKPSTKRQTAPNWVSLCETKARYMCADASFISPFKSVPKMKIYDLWTLLGTSKNLNLFLGLLHIACAELSPTAQAWINMGGISNAPCGAFWDFFSCKYHKA